MGAELEWERNPAMLLLAVNANRTGFLARFGRANPPALPPGARAEVYRTGVPRALFNGVSRIDASGSTLEETVGALVRWGHRGRLPWSVWVPDSEDRSRLPTLLLSYGLDRHQRFRALAMDLHTARQKLPSIPGLLVQRVGNDADLRMYLLAIGRGLPLESPGEVESMARWMVGRELQSDSSIRMFVGFLDGRPVATVTIYVEGPIAGIYALAVDPSVRGRHVGSAMISACLRVAAGWGCSWMVATVEESGVGPFVRLGFEEYETLSTFAIDPARVPSYEHDPAV